MGLLSKVREYATTATSGPQSATAWKEYVSDVYFDLDVELNGSEFIEGSLSKRTFADICVSSYRATPHGTRRTKQHIKHDKLEHHVFVFPVAGSFECRQRGLSATAASGAM